MGTAVGKQDLFPKNGVVIVTAVKTSNLTGYVSVLR
jgi:hypothetical protein